MAQKTSKKKTAFRTGTSKLWSFKKAAQGGRLLQNHHGSHLPSQVVVPGCWKRAISMTNHWICRFCQVRLSILETHCSTCSRRWKQASGEKERSQSRRARNERVEKEKPRNQNAGNSKTNKAMDCIVARLATFQPSVNETNRMPSWCRSPTSLHQKE